MNSAGTLEDVPPVVGGVVGAVEPPASFDVT
jgi:hypothetical protein